MKHDVVIVGAGLAGLACARHLLAAGRQVLLVEASDAVGGRVRTDVVDGFQLDLGFQVYLTAYPEAQAVFDAQALALHSFQPGALIRHGGVFHRLSDPWRQLWQGVRSVFNPIGTFRDKLRIATLRSKVLRGTLDERMADPETTTLAALRAHGFSDAIIERFFRPFLGGIFLERELQTSSRMFHFVFRMFALGLAALPAQGMGALPAQLAAKLPTTALRLASPVTRVTPTRVTLATGETLDAEQVVVAVEGPAAATLLGEAAPVSQGVTCTYFATTTPPLRQPVLVLNGEGTGPINNLCVPSVVAPSYAPAGQHLLSVTSLGIPHDDDTTHTADVRAQLRTWFGSVVDTYIHLRTYRIPHALPRQVPPALATVERSPRHASGVFVCGDHRTTASINGALLSGRKTAEAVLRV